MELSSRGGLVTVALFLGLAGCGSSTTETKTAADGGADSGAPGIPDAAPVDLGPDAAPVDKTPLPSTTAAKTWEYVPVDGAICRDGTATGIGVNLNPDSKELVIYLEGGGACFNSLTCATNPATFGMTEFTAKFGGAASGGMLDRTDTGNPVADWNMVYVPFCTGDVHAGDKRNATVPGVPGTQQFVGYANIARYLARIVPTFPGLTKVLLTGISAGGFGAAANYPQVARAFGSVPVYDLDDSGPPMEDPYAPKCLQQQWASLWGFDKTILADCGADCPDPTNYTIDASIHTAKLYPHIPFGVVEDTDDSVITLFYGFGANSCSGSLSPLSGATFTAGLLDSRSKLAAYPNIGSFVFQGSAHTSIGGATLDSVTAGGGDAATVKLSDWVTTLVNSGTVTNVGP